MKITVHSSKAVKPDYGSRPAPATDEVIPLTVLDEANFDTYISVIYAFHPPSPPNASLEAGLARCLAEYREWAGRLITTGASGGRGIVLNDAGARFVEATADAALGSAMPLEPTPDVLALHPCVGEDEPEPELMLIQATRFACGSLVVGFTTQHIVSDGRATGNFFVAWSQAVRGVPIDPAPVHGRASFFSPSSTPASKVQHQHRGVEFKPAPLDNGDNGAAAVREEDQDEVVVSKVHFSRDFISKLKSQASASVGRNQQQRPYSTLQCLVAHLWRGITKARGLLPDEPTSVSIAVDGRARIHTPRPIPEGYTGNVVLWARPTSTAQELTARPVSHAAELINKAVGRIDDGYFRSFVDFAGSGAVEEERLVPAADAKEMVLSPNIEVDSWLRMPFYDVDFGAGRPFFFMPSYLPVEGLLILLPSFLGDGSVDAYVPLFSRHMDTFKSCCHTLE